MRLGKTLAVLLALLCPMMAHAAACPTGYSNSQVFVIPHQNVGSTLTSFPVLLAFNGITPATNGVSTATSFTLPNLKVSGSGGKILSSGNDIVFCDAASGGNLLNFDRAVYTSTTGGAEFYVSRTVSSSADTFIWMFYGKASDTDHSAAAATWSAANYIFVSHFGDGSSLSVADSTGNTTPTNHSATATTGEISGGANFVKASSQYIDSGAHVDEVGGNVSLEMWMNQSTASGDVVAGNWNGSAGYVIYSDGTNTFNFTVGNGSAAGIASVAVPASTWTYVAGVDAANAMTFYVNGVSKGTNTHAIGTSTTNLLMGKWPTTGTQYNGSLDEVRVASVAHSADWIAASYLNQGIPTAFAIMVDASKPAGMSAGVYCVPLTVDFTKVPNTDQTNYPLLVRGIYPWMADTANGGFAVVGNSAHDIRFFSNNSCTTNLDFQRVYWTNTSGDSAWRVRVPTLSHTANTTIYVKIGASADTSDLSTAWMGSYNYVGEYAGGAPGVLSTTDSGSAGFTLSCGANVSGASTPLGGGYFFLSTGTDVGICNAGTGTVGDTLSAHGYPVGSTAGHIRMWGKATAATASGGTFNDVEFGAYGKANNLGQRGFQVEYRSTTYTGMQTLQMSNAAPGIVASNNAGSTPALIMDTNWHLYDFDQPTNGATFSQTALYVDGVPITSPIYIGATGSSVLNTDDTACCTNKAEVAMGRMAAHGVGWLTGFVAGFEVTNVSLSADNVKTRYNNEVSPSTFYSFGTAQTFGTTQPTVGIIM